MGETTTQPLKAYGVMDYHRDAGVVVFAVTRGQARAMGAQEIDAEFLEVEVRRASAFDDLTPETLTPRAYIERGWWQICHNWSKCCRHADEETVVWGKDDDPYCSEACRDAKETSAP